MFNEALSALGDMADPIRLAALFAGMFVGIVFGMLPGLGGVAAVSILLPFIFYLDDFAGLAMLLGAVSVVYTSDTITSVLIGAPGSPASAPTAIEGHALAKQGQASRALGVGFLASMVGGLVGAVILALAIPVAGPIVLMLGEPELFMFALVGLFFAASMVGPNLAKGLAAACVGILLGVVGPANAAADYRFTFGQIYLLDGLSLTIVALGLFGVAEVIGMLASGGGISHKPMEMTGWSQSFRDFGRNWFLILRSAVIGVFGGFVPAVGASASTWVAYGHAMRSTKDRSRFGKGELRGVAAAEGANNATVIADLVPTLLFSVPGGPAAAIFLGALFSFGYYPGPRMISQNPDLMYLIIWSVALTSVVGAAICFAIAPYLARLTRVPFAIIAAPLVLIMVIGAYQSTLTLGDIFMLFALGAIGWMMKHADWPRAPALVGFVLSGPMEQYFWLSNQLFGWSWLLRPGVLAIASIIALPLMVQFARWARARRAAVPNAEDTSGPAPASTEESLPLGAPKSIEIALALSSLVGFVYCAWEASQFNPSSRMMPLIAIVPGLPLSVLLLIQALRHSDIKRPSANLDEVQVLGVLVAYSIGIWAFGFSLPSLALLGWMLFIRSGMRPAFALLYGAIIFAAARFLFTLLRGDAPTGAILSLT
ncbi:tripartite tricarboxylate transporter permease [Roseivivax marinus]|uniref:tripartite tricarboxylate transporter permease n=1 Tax=Roseivivax marinus TaxID=1379903 RepID=UPI001F03E9EA|nr:tripartite tricarboxylate transporter permease [Roseivivax marinus]UMA64393.1 tripartite tricarboxylate transporter permease [Roseivivax marinus]